MIGLRNVRKQFGEKVVIDSFHLQISKGEFVALIGPNGCGKTTLMNMLCGIEQVSAGKMSGVESLCGHIGYVFQDYRKSLLPWLSGLENIEFPLKLRGLRSRERKKKITELSDALGVSFDLRSRVFHLSGGQAQTVSLLRALAVNPELLILDEPFSALDFESNLQLRETIAELSARMKLTTLLVSHDLEDALFLADRLVFLSRSPTHVLTELQISWPRPRSPELIGTAEFAEMKYEAMGLAIAKSQTPYMEPINVSAFPSRKSLSAT